MKILDWGKHFQIPASKLTEFGQTTKIKQWVVHFMLKATRNDRHPKFVIGVAYVKFYRSHA